MTSLTGASDQAGSEILCHGFLRFLVLQRCRIIIPAVTTKRYDGVEKGGYYVPLTCHQTDRYHCNLGCDGYDSGRARPRILRWWCFCLSWRTGCAECTRGRVLQSPCEANCR